MRSRALLLSVVMLLWVGGACAQTATFTPGGFTVSTIGNVKGAPFTGEMVTDTTRVLPGGNHTTQVNRVNLYRDSEGRTRTENLHPPMQITTARIADPVQRVSIILNLQEKMATVRHFPTVPASAGSAKPATNQQQPGAPAITGAPMVPKNHENLGTKDIDGLTVVGTRHRNTVPAGKVGNEKPIVSVVETWYSPELHQVILQETNDPQSGHHTLKLVNIQRIDPDPLLFQIPPDFTVRDENPPQQ